MQSCPSITMRAGSCTEIWGSLLSSSRCPTPCRFYEQDLGAKLFLPSQHAGRFPEVKAHRASTTYMEDIQYYGLIHRCRLCAPLVRDIAPGQSGDSGPKAVCVLPRNMFSPRILPSVPSKPSGGRIAHCSREESRCTCAGCATAAVTRFKPGLAALLALLSVAPASAFLVSPRCSSSHADQHGRYLMMWSTGGVRWRAREPSYRSCFSWLTTGGDSPVHESCSRKRGRNSVTGITRGATMAAGVPGGEPKTNLSERRDSSGPGKSVPGYGLFDQDSNELVRIELEEVPVSGSLPRVQLQL